MYEAITRQTTILLNEHESIIDFPKSKLHSTLWILKILP